MTSLLRLGGYNGLLVVVDHKYLYCFESIDSAEMIPVPFVNQSRYAHVCENVRKKIAEKILRPVLLSILLLVGLKFALA